MAPMPPLDYRPPTDPWLDVLYADRDVAALNKPSGLLSVPGRDPAQRDSAYTRALERWPLAQVVHRLDLGTSGLLLIALRRKAEASLRAQFQARTVEKVYLARVWGAPREESGTIDLPLGPDAPGPDGPRHRVDPDGAPARTDWQVLRRDGPTTLLRLRPHTGRSHQLRVHLLALGLPIAGDPFYAPPEARAAAPRLLLHAAEIRLDHPYSGQRMHLLAPLTDEPLWTISP